MTEDATMQDVLRIHAETLGKSGLPESWQLMVDAADELDRLERQYENLDGITLTMSQRISLLSLDATRYKKLRTNGNADWFCPVIVIRAEDAIVGTQTFSGERLDELLDQMEGS